MNTNQHIAQTLGFRESQVSAVVTLLSEGATIPFIARYRKEKTGSLDEVQIAQIADEATHLMELETRKHTILKTIDEQGKLTSELQKQIHECMDATQLEDLYLPYKPHRKTRADMAKEKGLEPLAKLLLSRNHSSDILSAARHYISKEVPDAETALQGARDIIAEWVNEDNRSRQQIRREFDYTAMITSKVVKSKSTEEEAQTYRDYFDFSERLNRCSSHRLLAMRRGENEGYLRVDISPDSDKAIDKLYHIWCHGNDAATDQIAKAVEDAYKRLLKPSIETEYATSSKQKADEEAIRIFAENARQLLLAAPLGQKRVLGLDPGYRTGCKLVVLSAQGDLLKHDVIYPAPPHYDKEGARRVIDQCIHQYDIQAIAIGNGTASRETESFVREVVGSKIPVFVVSEDGASIYSASEVARQEFPKEDVTVRGAVSIGRRLMDPLAELVKIEPKSIGVGQYQHDVDQTKLKHSLTQTVESVVNHVGVDVNTASQHLLTYISGLGPTLAQNIVKYRTENGPFASRKALLKVPKMGPKTFEQAAGFLRISNAANPLDNTAVHPERYELVERMARDYNATVASLIESKALRDQIDIQRYVNEQVGLPTLRDILSELDKPSRDPRGTAQAFRFSDEVHEISDLREGMVLPGIVSNLTAFGAFINIGVHQDGMAHISQIAPHGRRIASPAEILHLGQEVMVRVIEVDHQRKRIGLSLRLQ